MSIFYKVFLTLLGFKRLIWDDSSVILSYPRWINPFIFELCAHIEANYRKTYPKAVTCLHRRRHEIKVVLYPYNEIQT